MGGLLILLALSVVMALASFLAGALPLIMTLTQAQLRLMSNIGVGILIGTSLIVIIPEGIEAVVSTGAAGNTLQARFSLDTTSTRPSWDMLPANGDNIFRLKERDAGVFDGFHNIVRSRRDEAKRNGQIKASTDREPSTAAPHTGVKTHENARLPTFYIGFSLTLGFVLMFLIERLPRHATEKLQPTPATRHISLDNLAGANISEEENEGFLGSLRPTPKQSRSLATTTGLVIHATADGIAMGASATTPKMTLGLIIFVAIMIHKAPAAFGLTSVLLRQGLSKRAVRCHLVVFSLAAPFGALATYSLVSVLGGGPMEDEAGQWWTGVILLFSAGTFLYVAMHAMQEENGALSHDTSPSINGYPDGNGMAQKRQTKPQMRDTLATVGGMLLPLLTQFGHHH